MQIVSLITHNRQFGRRTWSGSHRITHRERGRPIAGANIQPLPCTR
jgi:hypothetical protein